MIFEQDIQNIMHKNLFTTKMINLDDKVCEIRYYRNSNFNGFTTYSSEVDFAKEDKIILDDYSIYSLEDKLKLILPVALHMRRLNKEGG